MVQAVLLVLYIILLALVSILVADFIFISTYDPLRYVKAKIELEKAVAEYRRLSRERVRDKRAERRLRKILADVHDKRRVVVRASFYRLLLLLPLYLAAAITVSSTDKLVPIPCCIPLLSIEVQGYCLILPSTLLLAAYIMFIPLIQEPVIGLLMARRRLAGRRRKE